MTVLSRITLIAAVSLLLTACDNDSGGGTAAAPTPAPTPPPTLQSQFGTGFEAAFDKGGAADADGGVPGGVFGPVDVTAEPNAVAAGDVIAVSVTADPVVLN